MTWTGTEPDLPSIVLNSHMDVVPVEEEHWTHPPFGAEIDSAGRIYGRGSQDAKQIGIQYLAAIDALKRQEVRLKRTVHIVFVPDEEVGSALGMAAFVRSDDFKSLNIGFALDEGRTSEDESFLVFYTQRTICRKWHRLDLVQNKTDINCSMESFYRFAIYLRRNIGSWINAVE